jgi:5'-3' exonuclease
MKTYLLVDTQNMFFRARHVAQRGASLDEKIGLAFHIMFNSIKKANSMFSGDHVVFCLEGRSWRKDVYEPYKKNRKVALDKRSAVEQEEDTYWWEAYDDFLNFLKEQTNSSAIRSSVAEADDVIALWIEAHKDSKNVIVSTDSDFYQLISPTVSLYNGMTNQIVTANGFYDEKDNPIIDKKTGQPKTAPDPEWLLFEKCIRGDSSDNVFTAFPKVRKTKIKEAFDDRHNQGFIWNNFMLSKWTDHNGNDQVVKECYERNKQLIDLSKQPDEVRTDVLTEIVRAQNTKNVEQVGVRFMKFCNKYSLEKLAQNPTEHAQYLNKAYK